MKEKNDNYVIEVENMCCNNSNCNNSNCNYNNNEIEISMLSKYSNKNEGKNDEEEDTYKSFICCLGCLISCFG
jgi:hypothetical protein